MQNAKLKMKNIKCEISDKCNRKSIKLPQGFLFSAVNCGIKQDKPDMGMIYCHQPAIAIGFFTTNVNPSYSVTFSKKNINNPIKAVLVNSGNANCYSHTKGLKDTENIAVHLAKALGVTKRNILFASTGIIGKKLPKEKIINFLPGLIKNLKDDVEEFSASIMTTDTFKKIYSAEIPLGKEKITLTGFAKGAGMIYPDMATMLAFIVTDAYLPEDIFKKECHKAVEVSFNSISIDGCMSTNDTFIILSSKKNVLKRESEKKLFLKKMQEVCINLATMIVKDAEGATKFIEIQVKGAKTEKEAKTAGLAIANSNLLKCAFYGSDANWGRIISALGQAGIKVTENISIKSTPLIAKEIILTIDLKRGKYRWKIYTSDLTPEYVKINAEYS